MDATTDITEIEAILAAWAQGVGSRDIEAVLGNHADDLLMFDVVGPVRLRGLDAYRAGWQEQFFAWHSGSGRFNPSDIDIRSGDRVAFATALLDCAGTENGAPAAFKLRLTVGFEKRAGRWTVVHEHHSEPLPFDAASIGGRR